MIKSKPRVAYVMKTFQGGGMANIAARIASHLQDKYDFFFIATEVSQANAQFYKLGTVLFAEGNYWRLFNLLKKYNVNIVQYSNERIYADAALAAGIPVVIERTDGLKNGQALRCKKGLNAVIASTSGTVGPISQMIEKDKIHLIYNGVDLEDYRSGPIDRLGFPDDDILIGRVSVFHPGKNIGILIDAVRDLVKRYPKARLVLVGGNSTLPGSVDEDRALRERAKGIEDHVVFTGPLEDPKRVIRGFDIGTCVSMHGHEGIPNSLMECMAAGKPVVSTNVDDVAELVSHGDSGFLFPDGDLESLVNVLERLIVNPGLRLQMGARGLEHIKNHFNLPVQAQVYGALYDSLLHEPSSLFELRIKKTKYLIRFVSGVVWRNWAPGWLKKAFLKAIKASSLLLIQVGGS